MLDLTELFCFTLSTNVISFVMILLVIKWNINMKQWDCALQRGGSP